VTPNTPHFWIIHHTSASARPVSIGTTKFEVTTFTFTEDKPRLLKFKSGPPSYAHLHDMINISTKFEDSSITRLKVNQDDRTLTNVGTSGGYGHSIHPHCHHLTEHIQL